MRAKWHLTAGGIMGENDIVPSEQATGSIQTGTQLLSDVISKAKTQTEELFTAVESVRQKAEEHLKATEASRKKADDDASYAYQAKVNTEEHAKATALFKGQAEADVNSISTNKKNAEESFAVITRVKADIEVDSKAINENRKAVDQASQEIVKAAQTGVAYLQEIEASRAACESASEKAIEAQKASEEARADSQTARESTAKLSTDAKTHVAQILDHVKTSTQRTGEIEDLLTDAQKNEAGLSAVLEHLAKSDEIAVAHEARVAKLAGELESLIKKAESLLPGFTSAGLASAFCTQRNRFAAPQKRWLRTFIVCMVLLAIVSLPSFLAAIFPSIRIAMTGATGIPSWSETVHGFVMRLPILVPLVWLAIYAGRNYMLSLRLEEDYAYKEAISTAFEGYKREMKDIAAGDADHPTPVTKLCVNILTALADRPGRIYDHHNKDITLANEAADILARANELGQKQTRTQ